MTSLEQALRTLLLELRGELAVYDAMTVKPSQDTYTAGKHSAYRSLAGRIQAILFVHGSTPGE